MTRAFVGLGSNLGDREATIRRALALLQQEPEVEVVRVSTLRETDPVGYLDQPRFLNGVAEISTGLEPRKLLSVLLETERVLGRAREEGPALGPRTIDLDLLLYGERQIVEPGLEVPHPRLHERRFVLEPLTELAPDAHVPGRGAAGSLLAKLD